MKPCSKFRHQRRQVLKLLLGTGLLSAFGPLLAKPDPLAKQLLVLANSLSRNTSIQRLGDTYNRTHPGEANAAKLVQLLEESSLAYSKGNSIRIEQTLDLAMRHDFGQDHIESIDGWWLSRTEARLYALSALLV